MKSQKIFVIVISDTPFKNTPDFTHWCKLVGFVFRQVVLISDRLFLIWCGWHQYNPVKMTFHSIVHW